MKPLLACLLALLVPALAAAAPETRVPTVAASAAPASAVADFDAVLQPVRQVTVTAQVGGNVLALRVKAGDTVTVHYIGVHGGSGEVFDASWTRGQPFDVQVGAGQVIKGWDQGLVGMKVGGRRRLEVPGDLAYGSEGRPPTIEPNETLVFLIDVLGIS